MSPRAATIASLVLLLAGTAALAQTATSGFNPNGSAPSVSIPAIGNSTRTVQTPTTQQWIERNGTTATTTDRLAPPVQAETAIGAGGQPAKPVIAEPAKSQTSAPTTTTKISTGQPKKYAKGQVISGKARVIDGQSLFVGRDAVRLTGLDAPGLGQICATSQNMGWRCGLKSKERLAVLVKDGSVRCVVTAQAGKGAAARCSATQVGDVGKLLISEGLAVANGKADPSYRGAMQSAAASGRGMWMGRFEAPSAWRKKNR